MEHSTEIAKLNKIYMPSFTLYWRQI